ncbi:MAG: dTDP-glucose 4,6-dehydratase [Verrucomicrobiota bacterium]|nr:dTDP-glucose 4,6-dehydratase [Verrucomicrobiota bacterium]
MNNLFVTGGLGFIGSNFIRLLLNSGEFETIINFDKQTYAGNPENLQDLQDHESYKFIKGDICDREKVSRVLEECKIDGIVNFAAESHVDRSIDGPEPFVQTNVVGTLRLLEASKDYISNSVEEVRDTFRFLHVSTDEVYGSLKKDEPAFCETTPFAPNSPYSASKASADHLVRSYHHTFGLPTLTTNCSNNYGPYQFPEKLIPLMIMNASEGKSLPIYGDGSNIRDWLHVEDHCTGILSVLQKGRIGETYCIGGASEKTNMEVIDKLCEILDRKFPKRTPHSKLKIFVKDRPGHDHRYAIDFSKIKNELDWAPSFSFEEGMEKTVDWYLSHQEWCENVTSGKYQRERLGSS